MTAGRFSVRLDRHKTGRFVASPSTEVVGVEEVADDGSERPSSGDLLERVERHDEQGDKEVGDGERDEERVGDDAQSLEPQHAHDHQHVAAHGDRACGHRTPIGAGRQRDMATNGRRDPRLVGCTRRRHWSPSVSRRHQSLLNQLLLAHLSASSSASFCRHHDEHVAAHGRRNDRRHHHGLQQRHGHRLGARRRRDIDARRLVVDPAAEVELSPVLVQRLIPPRHTVHRNPAPDKHVIAPEITITTTKPNGMVSKRAASVW